MYWNAKVHLDAKFGASMTKWRKVMCKMLKNGRIFGGHLENGCHGKNSRGLQSQIFLVSQKLPLHQIWCFYHQRKYRGTFCRESAWLIVLSGIWLYHIDRIDSIIVLCTLVYIIYILYEVGWKQLKWAPSVHVSVLVTGEWMHARIGP